MSDMVKSFYYPDMLVNETTLKKSLLLFDELHFADRPSFTFKGGGSIGAASPLRAVENSFRDDGGVPFYVHALPAGRVEGETEAQAYYDINNPKFLREFQDGLGASKTFKDIQVPNGNYGNGKTQTDEVSLIVGANLDAISNRYGQASDLFNDDSVKLFDDKDEFGSLKKLVFIAALTSVKITSAIAIADKEGFVPLADAAPYQKLLSARYAKACEEFNKYDAKVSETDICFSIMDEFVGNARLAQTSLKDIVEIRKKSEPQRRQFLKFVAEIQQKQSVFDINRNYSDSLHRLIDSEVRPAAEEYKNRLVALDESLFAGVVKSAVTGDALQQVVSLFRDLTWHEWLVIGAASSAALINEMIDRFNEKRAIRRECSISYVLDLDF